MSTYLSTKRKLALVLGVLMLVLMISACGNNDGGNSASGSNNSGTNAAQSNNDSGSNPEADGNSSEEERYSLVVGVTAGVHEQIVEKVREVAEANGLDIEIKVFSDFIIPNVALVEGELDANIYQHRPFLNSYKEEKGASELVDVAETVLNPMGFYSKKLKSIDEIKENDRIGLPNDPTNSARALLMFESAGLIKIREGVREEATVLDVVENPLNLELIELEAAQIPNLLDELAAAAINTSFATNAGLTLTDDAIFVETHTSPWVNVIVTTEDRKEDPAIQKLIEAYHSDETKKFIEETFKGAVVPLW
jgi:D-methionine transport system substrate-binding protein